MKLFYLPTQIDKYSSFSDFSNEFNLGEKDLILTRESVYNPFIKPLNLNCKVILQNKYGSGEPTDQMIDEIIKEVNEIDCNRIIAIGGGTVIDIAKLLIFENVNNTLDLFERKIPFIKNKKLIIIPTTCGTGSEVTNISIAEIKSKQTKMGLADNALFPDNAVIIPKLVKDIPYKYFIFSAIDALIHAVESYVSPKSNSLTESIGLHAIELILKGFIEINKNGQSYYSEIIEDFCLGSNYAGIVFGNTGVGAVHALSYPLGGNYHVPHGESNYQFLIEVFKRYNKLNPNGKIKSLNNFISNIIGCDTENVYDSLEDILSKLLNKKPLKEFGMKEEEILIFTESVLEKQQRLLANNYTPFSKEEIFDIYKSLF